MWNRQVENEYPKVSLTIVDDATTLTNTPTVTGKSPVDSARNVAHHIAQLASPD